MADTASQSNTKRGPLQYKAGETLTGMEGRLVRVTNNSGVQQVILPNDVADETLFVLIEGAASGEYVTIQPLESGQQFRAYTDGAIAIGASVVLAAIDGTKDGKVRTIPATADTYFRVGVCEAAADADSLALIRFAPKEVIVS